MLFKHIPGGVYEKRKVCFFDGGVLGIALAAGIVGVGCDNIHDIDLSEKGDSVTLYRQDIVALRHLEKSHEVSEEDLQNRLAEFLKSESVSRNAEGTESVILGSKKYVTRIEKGFS